MICQARALLRREDGSATLWFAVIAAALFALAGLVADGSSKASAARVAQMAANEAARAAGQHLSADAIEGNAASVDPGPAANAAEDYLAQIHVSGSVSVQGTDVVVTTSVPWSPRFLPVGSTSLTGHATTQTVRT